MEIQEETENYMNEVSKQKRRLKETGNTIRKRQQNFLDHIMRKERLENSCLTEDIESKKDRVASH